MKTKRHILETFAGVLMLTFVFTLALLRSGTASGYPSKTDPTPTSPPTAVPNYTIQLPLVMNQRPPVVEAPPIPPCRWPHTVGAYTGFAYSWGSNLTTPGTTWRVAFEAAFAAWNIAPTKTYFTENAQGTGPVFVNTYYALDNDGGKAQWYCSVPNPTTTVAYDVLGNTAYSYSNSNGYQAYAGHESGHGQSLGHVGGTDIALLGNNPDIYTYYTPQQPDIDLVNQVYP